MKQKFGFLNLSIRDVDCDWFVLTSETSMDLSILAERSSYAHAAV